MMNGAQGAETGALAIGYNAVDEAQGAIDGHLQAIRGQLQDASQGWKGEAANAFAGLMGDFDTAANNLQGVLSNLGTNLRTVEGIQATQEDEATTAARNAAGGDLPGLNF